MSEQTICKRCIVDSSVPGHDIDSKGECAYCRLHDLMVKEYPNDERGAAYLLKLAKRIKKAGAGEKYDCVAGISGGRDSVYQLYLLKKKYGLRPLAVHFNDGFGNPVAGKNMQNACKALDVDLYTVTSDWRESKDLKLAFLKASSIDIEEAVDVGIATALYGAAAKHNIKYVMLGQSFRTEGICPLEWNYLDGVYLKNVHMEFGEHPLRPWTPDDPGFNLGLRHMFYYVVMRRIKTIPWLYYSDYVRADAQKIIETELGWEDTGAHYFDDLYQSIVEYLHRVKFSADRRKFNYGALVRSGQMDRDKALELLKEPYKLEDPDIIRLCIKRLGLTQEEFDEYVARPPKTFRDFKTTYGFIRAMRFPIWLVAKAGLIPMSAYAKYFHCG